MRKRHGMRRHASRIGVLLAGAAALLACEAERDAVVVEPAPAVAPAPQLVVFRCDEDDKVLTLRWVDGEPELDIDGQLYPLRPEVSASGARYVGPALEFWSKGNEARLRRGGEELDCSRDHHATIWSAARAAGIDFRALGNEPGWRLDIREGQSISLLLDYGQRELLFSVPELEEDGDRRIYRAALDELELEVETEEKPCFDSMSGEAFSHHVSVSIDDRQLKGCGRSPRDFTVPLFPAVF